ncbi:hypothetical protein J3A65_004747 [Rhizobium sp. PvP014]|nr:hypothetical protein [Rhizobium sp. PvP014]MBP2532286.1 hypothetical protein [Rhizobium sp. PvP099]
MSFLELRPKPSMQPTKSWYPEFKACELTSATAPGLKAYLEPTNTIKLPSIMHATTPMLWLVDVVA